MPFNNTTETASSFGFVRDRGWLNPKLFTFYHQMLETRMLFCNNFSKFTSISPITVGPWCDLGTPLQNKNTLKSRKWHNTLNQFSWNVIWMLNCLEWPCSWKTRSLVSVVAALPRYTFVVTSCHWQGSAGVVRSEFENRAALVVVGGGWWIFLHKITLFVVLMTSAWLCVGCSASWANAMKRVLLQCVGTKTSIIAQR